MRKLILIASLIIIYSSVGVNASQNYNNPSHYSNNDSVAIVYFIKEITPENVLKIYKALGVDFRGKTGVKIHFGEDGNKNFLNPLLTKPLMEYTGASWVETNVLYVG
ncbi:MAG: ferredoxin, partial [Bacteroidales bacterium]|nr:ferredoxin [Bacteroidales bacterium]